MQELTAGQSIVMGGPPETAGLSPRMTSCSRISTSPKDTDLDDECSASSDDVVEIVEEHSVSEKSPAAGLSIFDSILGLLLFVDNAMATKPKDYW